MTVSVSEGERWSPTGLWRLPWEHEGGLVWGENLDGMGALQRHILQSAPFKLTMGVYRMIFKEWPQCPWKPRDYAVRARAADGEVLWSEGGEEVVPPDSDSSE